VGRDPKNPRIPQITVNNLAAMTHAIEHGVGIAVLPDYCVQPESGLVRLLPQADMTEMDCFLVYAEEMKNVVRVSGLSRLSHQPGAALALLRGEAQFGFRPTPLSPPPRVGPSRRASRR
jgi:hypothetical protein